MILDTLLSPADLPALARRDLRGTACVVFDILRATSTLVTALHHGATAVIPVSEIGDATDLRGKHPEFLLAGERDGVRIRAAQSGGMDFDFGNSPREFTPERVRGKTIVSTTTNGTRALRSCAGAKWLLAGSFLNMAATADFLKRNHPPDILLVCSGTGDGVADEDVLAAGALVELLITQGDTRPALSDSGRFALESFSRAKSDLAAALGGSKNGRRLLGIPELADDVAFCARRDCFNLVAADAAGVLRRV